MSATDTPGNGKRVPRVFVDARCDCTRCTSRTTEGYRMIGRCSNCGVEALVLYRAGDKSAPADCPTCGVWRSIHTTRLATPDEIPTEFEAAIHGE